jgi:hypothetical protein
LLVADKLLELVVFKVFWVESAIQTKHFHCFVAWQKLEEHLILVLVLDEGLSVVVLDVENAALEIVDFLGCVVLPFMVEFAE